ncbi:MAG: diguanylate cyclase, partial [Turicibacter sp.]
IAESYRIKGNIEYRQNNFEVAKTDFEQAYRISLNEKFSEIEMNSLFDWGKLLFVAGEYEKSELKLLKAFSIAQEYEMPLSFKKISDQLILLYKEVKNYELALHFYEVYQEYEKTLELKRSNLWGAKLKHEKSVSEARLFKELYDEIFLISNIGLVLTSKLSYDKLLIKVHDELSKLMDVSIFGITELNEEENRLEYALYHQLGNQLGKGIISFEDETSLGVYCVKNKRNILMNDIHTEYTKFIPKKEKFKIVSEGIHSIIMCPLIVHDEVKGFITVQSTQKSAYTQNDLNKTKLLASYVAIAIENAKLYRQTKYYASHDGLTGVFNRVVCLRKAENMLKKLRNKTPLSVIMLDIDYFKKINDTYGHQIGDQVLIQVGQILQNYSHENIVIGRYGGEEFLIFLQDYNHIQAQCFAEKIRMEISNCLFFINKSKDLSITASLGVYEYANSTITLDEGIYYADAALYRSKQKGRNMVSTFV